VSRQWLWNGFSLHRHGSVREKQPANRLVPGTPIDDNQSEPTAAAELLWQHENTTLRAAGAHLGNMIKMRFDRQLLVHADVAIQCDEPVARAGHAASPVADHRLSFSVPGDHGSPPQQPVTLSG
jgi:hypothetical protein